MEVTFHINGFDNVSWKTAQSTGALAYMSYAEAEEYSEIYDYQDEINAAQHQAVRDAIISVAPFVNMSDKDPALNAEAVSIKQHIEILQAQLILLNDLVAGLDGTYKKFLATHPD